MKKHVPLPTRNQYWDQVRNEILLAGNLKEARKKLDSQDILIPTAIFLERKLSFFEALAEYLKEVYSLSYSQIAYLTGKDQRNIWTIYNRASKKREGLPYKQPKFSENIFFPLSVLRESGASPLESAAFYLKQKGLQNRDIARLLGRSSKTIWTAIDRAGKKQNLAARQNPEKGGDANE